MERKIVKLFVIGATGRTGREVIQQALARNHHVTAFVRSPASLTLKNERLSVLKGNAMDENQLFRVLRRNFANVAAAHPVTGREIYCNRAGFAGDRRLVDSKGYDRHDNFSESDPRACAF